ncbi:MAG: NTP transferase domain-containing protein [Pseudomonadota bacterium]
MTQPPAEKFAASCLILAGGQGRRLTPDKPLLEIAGLPIIQRTASVVTALFDEVLVITNTPDKYGFLGLPLVADQRKGCGPLMGIYSGLSRIKHDVAFVCAADMPFLDQEVIRRQFHELDGFDIVVPCPGRKPEFLHAFYRRRCLPVIRETLEADLFKVEALTRRCHTLHLDEDWFARQGLTAKMELAFANVNTPEDYGRWQGRGAGAPGPSEAKAEPPAGHGPDPLQIIAPEVLRQVRETLIQQETSYQHKSAGQTLSSLWAHSSRVGRIAHHIAQAQGWEPGPALLAGLLHDTGKFVHGRYHEDDIPEETNAAQFARRVLTGTVHEPWLPTVSQAILTMYLEEEATSDTGRVVHDADNLDKLGCMGVAQYFAKNALRRRFLDDELLARASIELTYAHHARDTLKTATGRSLAWERNLRTRRFYGELLEEWAQLGLGAFNILEEDIAGIQCILVVARACPCGGRLDIASDIRDAIKCRSVLVKYACADCGRQSEYTFCLPNLKGLPRRRQEG